MPAVEPQAKSSSPRVIYWFRTDLRLHDSPALKAALDLEPEVLFPIWTWDPHYVYRARVGPNRWQFLIDCLHDLSTSLTRLNPSQKLHLIRSAPLTILPKLFKLWRITHLVFEKDTDGYARARDQEAIRLARAAGVQVITRTGRTLYDSDELVRCNGNRPTMSISQTQRAASGLGDPARPIPSPTSLPDPGDVDLKSLEPEHEIPMAEPDFNGRHRTLQSADYQYKSLMGPNRDFAIPTLEEMGIQEATSHIRGGEMLALKALDTYCQNESYVGTFEKPKTAPTDFEPQSTTLLSPHLHFGSLSVREFYWRVQDVIQKRRKEKKPLSELPVNLPGQLLFRDMYFGAQAALGYSFAQCAGNKVCRFVPWHLPSTISKESIGENVLTRDYTIDCPQAEERFQRWKWGRTGFPWIDALMRQLRFGGWIHHLGRHAVASFLTRGGCYVHWERGAEVFEEWLVDHETASNSGNWMWLSCTAFFSQFYRVYSPVAFGRKTDPEGNFVRRFVPELRRFDKKYIYEPWKAPIADQKAWGCRIEGDGSVEVNEVRDDGMKVYPKPMFDFNERRKICIQGMKKAYDVGMYGDDERVLNGKWKEIFDFKIQEGGGQEKEQMNGIMDRRRKRTRGKGITNAEDLRQDVDDGKEHGKDGRHIEQMADEEKPKKLNKTSATSVIPSSKNEATQGGTKRQMTLDIMIRRKIVKR